MKHGKPSKGASVGSHAKPPTIPQPKPSGSKNKLPENPPTHARLLSNISELSSSPSAHVEPSPSLLDDNEVDPAESFVSSPQQTRENLTNNERCSSNTALLTLLSANGTQVSPVSQSVPFISTPRASAENLSTAGFRTPRIDGRSSSASRMVRMDVPSIARSTSTTSSTSIGLF